MVPIEIAFCNALPNHYFLAIRMELYVYSILKEDWHGMPSEDPKEKFKLLLKSQRNSYSIRKKERNLFFMKIIVFENYQKRSHLSPSQTL